jgi:polysaccharide chain length determinant protein (PEP-CTERM system associated)
MNESYKDVSATVTRRAGLLQQGRSQLEELIVVGTSIVQGMWRYRWPALLFAWATCAVGWTFVYAMPDVYQASTRFYIDAESMIKRAVGDLTISGDMSTEVNILTRAIVSRPRLEETARLADLDLNAKTPAEHDRLISDLGARIILTKEGGDNIYRITFRDSSHQVAETVVKTILDKFYEEALGARRTDSAGAEEFVDQQIADYERRLNEAEQRRAAFKRQNVGLMPGESGDYYTRLQGAMQTLEASKAELRLATERLAEYQKQLAGEEPVFGIVAPSASDGVALGGTEGQIAQYEGQLSDLLLKYTDNHPDVVALRDTIARLKSQRDAASPRSASAAPRASTQGGQLETNPVYQSMRMGESATKVEIATLRSKVETQEAAVKELQRLVDTIPEIERELAALNRDYDVTRDQYETLLKRRESLRITGEVEQTGDQLQFRTLDPPRASVTPVGPDRPMLLAATAIAAIGLGLALALLLQQLNPVFENRRELRAITGLPVLGIVSLADGTLDRARARRRTLLFGATAVALPTALAVAVLLQGPAHRLVAGLLKVLPS